MAVELDDLDRLIIHSVQISPRAPWTALAPVLGADAVTLARRWERLRTSGAVYTTAVDRRLDAQVFTFLQIECRPADTDGVVAALVRDPAVTTVDRTAGSRSLMATLVADDAEAIAAWARTATPRLPGITSLRTLPITAVVGDARAWRLRALSAPDVKRVEATIAPTPVTEPRLAEDERRALIDVLSADPRTPVSTLATSSGISTRRIHRSLAWMLGRDLLSIRIDVARALTPWPVYIWYFLRVPASRVARVTPVLSQLPEMRVVAPVLGEYNIVFAAWLRSLESAQKLEAALERELPDVVIADRSLVLHTEKHVGHVLDASGLATGEVVPLVTASARR
jgi:DNA-binding Lrp family transcriptional regulator